jgi:phage-related protein
MYKQVRHAAMSALTAFFLAGGASLIAKAQTPAPQNTRPSRNAITRGELARLDNFLDAHPEIERDLDRNPRLIDDPQFLATHPELDEFLKNHPGVRTELQSHPRYFIGREKRFERRERGAGGDATRGELKRFDGFLDDHRAIAADLNKNPKLIDDPQYLATHPELDEYLKNHPGVRGELMKHPRYFMRRERGFERRGERREANTVRPRR